MPKETFFNLNTEKREKIEQAILNEFSRVPFSKASISNIIEDAKIPRGSFYQYFEDKEDAVRYIMQKYLEVEHNTIKNFLIETKGNIFEVSLKIYDYMAEKVLEGSQLKLYKNILEELKKNNITIFDGNNEFKMKDKLDAFINVKILKIQEEKDLKYIMKIISSITRTTTMDVVSKRISKEEGRKELVKQLEILKRGMLK